MTKKTYFVQLPNEIHCQTMHKLQDYFLERIVSDIDHPNIIYAFNFSPTLTFGSKEDCNYFSQHFENYLIRYIRSCGRQIKSVEELYSKEILDFLLKNGVNKLDFMISSRGGGATYLGPGQRTYFTNLNLKNGKNKDTIKKEFVKNIDEIMLEITRELVPNPIQIETRDKLDLTYIDENIEHKLGSRGFKLTKLTNKGLTKLMSMYGLSFHLHKIGLEHFSKIMPCGIPYNKVNPISFEDILNRQISNEEFDRVFVQKFEQIFPFELEINKDFNNKVIRVYNELLNSR